MHGELKNFLSRDAWEFLSREKLPKGRKPLHCRWIFKEKVDGTKKSRSVIKGYEQIPGVDFHESYSPLASNTTVRIFYLENFTSGSVLRPFIVASVGNLCVPQHLHHGRRNGFIAVLRDRQPT